jgi:phospho-N-acetylmuramoyl-pentapeptide-transferase
MLYHIAEYFKAAGIDIPGFGLFGYLSFRAIAAFTIALLISIFAGKRIIGWLQKKQIGETIRDLGLEGQMQKKGTPTMGGIIIFIALIIPMALVGDFTNIYNILLIVSTVWFFLIGFTDDYIKVFKKNKEGLSEKGKLAAQGLMALAIGLAVCFSNDIVVRENITVTESMTATYEDGTEDASEAVVMKQMERHDVIKSTKTTIPFVKNHEFDYKWLSPFKGSWGWYCKWIIYVMMIIIVITACSNGVNLTDGMDGLAAGTSAIVGVVLGIFAWLGGNIVNAEYLNIMYIPGSGEIAVFMSALVGALIGFLWYNTYPAQVFMGDTGSLMLGGIIGVTAVLIRKELLIPVLCGVFFAESVSVLLQRGWFRYTKKKYGEGRRIFKMTPIHHHFEMSKWSEYKIVISFSLTGAFFGILGIALVLAF